MLVPIEWLRDYIQIDNDLDMFCDKMIMSGSNIETCETFCENMRNVVVGKIIKIEKHPDADKLVVCKVDVGEEIQIVTGASNVFEGAIVPVALHNSKIPGPLHGQPKKEDGEKITKGKLRGIESFGMLCSVGELGFDDKVVPIAQKDGIWILTDEYKVGMDFKEALALEQSVVDFEITPNRPDCLAMIGIAREASATFKKEFSYPDYKVKKEDGKGSAKDYVDVKIEAADLCKRYVAKVVTDIKIEQSPWWLQKRLMYAGMRPINNIVDVTNFVMLEYGQPIHAFDIEQIKGSKIIVDKAAGEDEFTTLDDTVRKLDENMLLIKDEEKGIAIAGVMGGLNSEIQDTTKTIIIESANFANDSIRSTSKKLALRTEASARFEKGIDPNICEIAAERVCNLLEQIGAGKVCEGSVDVYPEKYVSPTIDIRTDRINHIMGIELSREKMVDIFHSLEIKTEGSGNVITVTPPSIRQDLVAEEDYVEEVARIYGYDKLPITLPKGNSEAGMSKERKLRNLIRDSLCAMGANEIQTYSFVSPKGLDNISIPEDSWERELVKITNPLGEENSVMRTILTPNMMEVLSRNNSRNIDEVKAFEIGNTFIKDMFSEDNLPDENYSLCIGAYGAEEDFFTLKGMIEELLGILGLEGTKYTAEKEHGTYHPGRCARISIITSMGEIECGIMGEIHPDVAERYGLEGVKTYCCELMLDNVIKYSNREVIYKPLPKYPSTSRDIALIVEEDMSVGIIEEVIKKEAGNIFESVKLFDVYRGKQVEEGKKSIAFTIAYRDQEKTLTDEEVMKVHSNVLEVLKEQFNALLREM